MRGIITEFVPDETEREILYLLSIGERYEDLGLKYGKSREVMKNKVNRMREEIKATNATELVAEALRKGWIT